MAVFELVARHGVDGLGMRRVAEKAGVSTGTLGYRFGNKSGLLDAALDYAYQPPRDFAQHRATARATLERLLQRYVLRRPKVRVWWRFYCAVVAHAAKDRRLARRIAENRRLLVQFFAAAVAVGIESGEVQTRQSPAQIAERLVTVAHGAALSQLVDGSPAAVRAAEAILAAELDRLRELHGRATLGT